MSGASGTRGGRWATIARLVHDHPVWVLIGALVIMLPPLLALSVMQLSHNTLEELPADSPSVQGFETLSSHFPPGEIAPVILVIDSDEPVTEPAAFRAIGDLSRNLKRLDVVATVRSAAMPTNGEVPEVEGTQGIEQITAFGDRLQQAADGAGRIRDGARRLRDGLAEIDARLPELASGLDEASAGVQRLLEGVAQLRDGTDRLAEGLRELRGGLEEARDGAGRLRTEVAIPAEENIRAAWDTLFDEFTVGRGDPEYEDALREVGEVYGRITGEDPRTGQQVEEDYEGLPEALARLENGLGDAVAGTNELLDGVARLDGGLAEVDAGLLELRNGLEEAQPGVAELQQGIDQLLDGAERLAEGAATLREGLADGVARIRDADLAALIPGADEQDGPFVITPGILQAMPEIEERLDFFLAEDDTRTRLFIGLDRSPFAPESLTAIDRIDDIAELSLSASPLEDAAVFATGTTAFFNGLDAAADRDFGVLLLGVLLGVFVVLVLLLRSLVAPIYMVATVLLSFGTALGVTTLLFQGILGEQGLAWWIPPFLFVLLVALGADYNIYLMSRVREEAQDRSTVAAVREATRLTGGVITSAGLILAGTFAAMMSAEMNSLVQMGFATTAGILLDTFVVRTFLVPSIATLLGRRNWWPSSRASATAEAEAAS
ncbi:MAG: MMPL family transporter [Nitriliruptorales bacterium]|nr:MMPL family transporter [Nitriliruptorales bacterium]